MWFNARFIVVVALALIVYTPFASAAEKNNWQGVERVVAIGDLHGGYKKFVKILRKSSLINKRNHWIGGKTHLVQAGDVVDRGPDSRKIIDLLRKLEKEAVKDGGFVHALIGNHEAMMVHGDLRYVHEGEYKAFRNRRSRRLQSRYYESYVASIKTNLPEEEWPEFDNAYRDNWKKRFPLGFVEHRLNWLPEGRYGKWVVANNTVIIINETMFVHGGISAKYGGLDLAEINARIEQELSSGEIIAEGIVTDPEGPLWYRGLAMACENDVDERIHLDALMERHNIRRIVVGHTFTPGAIVPRFDGRVIQIDVGLSPAYGNNHAFLVIEAGVAIAVHRGHPVPLPDGSNYSKIEYLRTLAALDPQPSPLADTIAALEAPRAASGIASPGSGHKCFVEGALGH